MPVSTLASRDKAPKRPVSTAEAADLLQTSVSTLAYMRKTGLGPQGWITEDGSYCYDRKDVLRWKKLRKNRVSLREAARRLNVPYRWLNGVVKGDEKAPRPLFQGYRAYVMKDIAVWFRQKFGENFQNLLTAAQIARRLSVTRSLVTLYKKQDDFPEPTVVSGDKLYWDVHVIDAWWRNRKEEQSNDGRIH